MTILSTARLWRALMPAGCSTWEMMQVNRNRFFLLLFCILCIVFIGSRHYFSSTGARSAAADQSPANSPVRNELSLMEAYRLALPQAKAWSTQAQLVLATSVDDSNKELAGTTGTRAKWNLLFANVTAEETLLVAVENGTIVKASTNKEKTMENTLVRPDLMKTDSKDVIEKARRDFNLQPGKEWANGYHFSIMNNGKQTYMTVTGLSAEGQFTQIFYDVQTGECIGSKVQPK
jgi:hypothetical protein